MRTDAQPDRAAKYARISEDKKGLEAGVTRQLADETQLAKNRGLTVVGEYVDNDLSATKGGPRPAYAELVAAIKAGKVDTVLVWHLSRLWRNRKERAEGIELFKAHRVRIICCKGPDMDLSSAYGRGMVDMLGAYDSLEVEIKGERTQAAQLQKARAGGWLGGTRPFGWKVDGSVRRHAREAAAVRRATRAVLAGESLASIIRDMNGRGLTTTTGRPWAYATARQMLMRPRNAGIVEYGGEQVGTWPALVTEDEWRACRAILDDPARRKSQSNRPKWLLSGILGDVCGTLMRAGTTQVSRTNDARRAVYRCFQRGAGQHACPDAQLVDTVVGGGEYKGEWVTGLVVARLRRPDAADLLVPPGDVDQVRDLNAEAVALRLELQQIAEMRNRGQITLEQVAIMTDDTRRKLAAIEAEIEAADRNDVLGDIIRSTDVAERWAGYSLSRRRAVIRELFDELTALPAGRGHRWDPTEHLRYRWKGQS